MTPNRENIIKALYSLGLHKKYISNKELAEHLEISPPSVSEMLTKLKNSGHIEYVPYKGCYLTEKGIASALQVVRYHRLWEVFLINHLGFSWGDAHQEAELLEHATTEHLAIKLDQFLNHPKYCPYDMVSPNSDSRGLDSNILPLHQVEEGQQVEIVNFLDDPNLLDHLQKLGIQVGMHFVVLEKAPYDGDIKIKGICGEISISLKACSRIFARHI